MEFLPLAIWAVGFYIASTFDDYVTNIINPDKFKDPAAYKRAQQSGANTWCVGCFIFFVLGFIMCISHN